MSFWSGFQLTYNFIGATVTGESSIYFPGQAGDAAHMELDADRFSDPPILWSIPFTILLITIILAAADTFLPFIPLNQSPQTWTWLASTMVTAIMASLVAETITRDGKRGLLSMVVGAVVFSLAYKNIINIFQRSVVDVVQSSIPNPLLGTAVYTSILTVLPGALSGIVLGGVFGVLPGRKPKELKENLVLSTTSLSEITVTYEMLCSRCGHTSSRDSKFCPFCGIEVTRREVPVIKYCMFCGGRINYLGQFCPDCGLEIDQASKPQIYFFR